MTITHPTRRRVARDLTRALSVVCALMLTLSVWTVIEGGTTPLAAATAGTLTLTPTSGDYTTSTALTLPAGAACTGDTASGGYRWQTYLVPSTVDLQTLRFDAFGPVPVAGQFRTPLNDTSNGNPIINKATSVSSAGAPGLLTGLMSFGFSLFLPGEIPAGSYSLGVACTLGLPSSPTQLDKFWSVQYDITATATGFTWVLGSPPGSTTTTTTGGTTTTAPGDTTTTTAAGGTTTTTAAGGSTTTVAGGSSTTVAGGGSGGTGSTTFSGGNPSSAALASTVGQLPYTGNSPWSLVVWGAMLLVFGRMAILLGRKPKVRALGE